MLWRRMRGVLAHRRDWTEADFVSSLVETGSTPEVAALVLRLVRPYYHPGVIPQRNDSFARFLAIDEAEIEDLVKQASISLDLSQPTASDPERIPELATVGDLSLYLNARYGALSQLRSRARHEAE